MAWASCLWPCEDAKVLGGFVRAKTSACPASNRRRGSNPMPDVRERCMGWKPMLHFGKRKMVRHPGDAPGSPAWRAGVLLLNQCRVGKWTSLRGSHPPILVLQTSRFTSSVRDDQDWPTGFAPAPPRSQRGMLTLTTRPMSGWKVVPPAGNAPASAV